MRGFFPYGKIRKALWKHWGLWTESFLWRKKKDETTGTWNFLALFYCCTESLGIWLYRLLWYGFHLPRVKVDLQKHLSSNLQTHLRILDIFLRNSLPICRVFLMEVLKLQLLNQGIKNWCYTLTVNWQASHNQEIFIRRLNSVS